MTENEVMRETVKHANRVGELMVNVTEKILLRAVHHDESKFSPEEWEGFAKYTPQLAKLTYGSVEYREALKNLQPYLDYHYARNAHHPEHFGIGIKDMNLIDILEMLCDWKAATERHENGDLRASIELNSKRFGYGDDLKRMFYLTAVQLGWLV